MSKKLSSEEEDWERDAIEESSESWSRRNCLLIRLADDDYKYMETVEWIKYFKSQW